MIYVDPNGLYDEPFHKGLEIAGLRDVFGAAMATKIANGYMSADDAPGKNFLPLFGEQGRHFNTNVGTGKPDSRDVFSKNDLNDAVTAQNQANKLACSNNISAADGMIDSRNQSIKYGVHSTADKDHPQKPVFFGWYHPIGEDDVMARNSGQVAGAISRINDAANDFSKNFPNGFYNGNNTWSTSKEQVCGNDKTDNNSATGNDSPTDN